MNACKPDAPRRHGSCDAPTPGTIRADAHGGERSEPRSANNVLPANMSLALLGNGTKAA
jgi:hypothetical protein